MLACMLNLSHECYIPLHNAPCNYTIFSYERLRLEAKILVQITRKIFLLTLCRLALPVVPNLIK